MTPSDREATGLLTRPGDLVQLLDPSGTRHANPEFDRWVADVDTDALIDLHRDMVVVRRLDAEATAMLNEIYNGGEVDAARMKRIIGLFRVDFRDPIVLRPEMAGAPVFLGLAAAADGTLRMKPQNLLMNLPLARRA